MITVTLLISAVFSLSPLVDVSHPGARVAARLHTSIAYEAIAPLSNVLDTLTLLSPTLYWAILALAGLVFVAFWTYRSALPRSHFDGKKLIRAALTFVGATISVPGIMLVVSRPMASLSLHDRDLIAVDFHSHTDASHDGRAGFSPEKNRQWHSSAGFNAVYVTDHRTFDGALGGARRNQARAGDRTVLLPGVELRDGDEHPILIGVDPKRMRIASPDWKGAAVAADGGPAPPMLLLSLPGDILRIPFDETSGPVRIAGIEISDGSPRGMGQAARDGDAILSLAEKLNIAIVSASDNHGWGRTAPAWSVLRVPRWRDMTPSQLDIAIRRTIAVQGFRAVQVIARRTVGARANNMEIALGGVAVVVLMLRTMSLSDRFSWIAWAWALSLLPVITARHTSKGLRVRIGSRPSAKLPPAIDAAA
jgi:hypothetical protein